MRTIREGIEWPELAHPDERAADRLQHRLPYLEFPVPRIRRTFDDHRPPAPEQGACPDVITGIASKTHDWREHFWATFGEKAAGQSGRTKTAENLPDSLPTVRITKIWSVPAQVLASVRSSNH
jgi:hypothetical protein